MLIRSTIVALAGNGLVLGDEGLTVANVFALYC